MGSGEKTYRGLPGAFRYSFRTSSSVTYKSYVLVSAILTVLVTILFVLGLIGVVASTVGASEIVTLVRSFFILVGVLVVVPIVAPVLLVARRHRRGVGADAEYDARIALGGYLFVASLYIGLVISVPPEQQEPAGGVVAPVVEFLYGLPPLAGVVPPTVAAVGIYLLHRRYR